MTKRKDCVVGDDHDVRYRLGTNKNLRRHKNREIDVLISAMSKVE
jgi:hypothetical protein